MRKLKDLKENECIEVRNEKEAKKLKKLLKKEGIYHWGKPDEKNSLDLKRVVNENFLKIFDGLFTYYKTPNGIPVNGSDFIKPNKSKLKQISKDVEYLKDFVANMGSKNVSKS